MRLCPITWLAGETLVWSYAVPGTRHERSFCGQCGSSLPGLQGEGSLLVVPAGSIDGPVGIAPTAHICCADQADWDGDLQSVPRLDGLPG